MRILLHLEGAFGHGFHILFRHSEFASFVLLLHELVSSCMRHSLAFVSSAFLEGLPARDSPFPFPSKVAAIGVWREKYIHNRWTLGVLILFDFWYRAYRMGNYIGWSFGI